MLDRVELDISRTILDTAEDVSVKLLSGCGTRLTVCSSIHLLPLKPTPSTNLRWRIWKCTGGPPNAVKPRSHILTKTSVRRPPSSPVLACREPLRCVRALALQELMIDWSGIVAICSARCETGKAQLLYWIDTWDFDSR